MKDKDIPISDTDELSTEGGRDLDRARRLGEFKPTNAPLSAAEIRERKALLGTKRRRREEKGPLTKNVTEPRP
jgi:hypothetical protein